MKLKFIFFDFGGTLDSDGIHWRKRFYDIYLKNGINLTYEDFSKAFFDSDDNLHLRHNLKNLSFDETVYLQVRDVFKYLRIDDEEKIKSIAKEFIDKSKNYINRNKNVLQKLKEKGIKLGVISNFYGNLESVLKSLGIYDFFDAVADSEVAGYIKPSKEIFDYAINKLNAQKEFSAMVGDSFERDIKSSHNYGIYHFYLTQEPPTEKCCDKLYIISKTKDILNYV